MKSILSVAALVVLAACSHAPQAPATFRVQITTSKGPFTVEVHRDWAPNGADRFYELVKDGFYDGNRFFRIVPGFVVQWGINGDPAVQMKWRNKTISDDPVKQSNTLGTITFATSGPNTRTTQLFINLGNNTSLDAQGFAPFGQVISGLNVVESLYSGYGEMPDQNQIQTQGNAYLQSQFPMLDYIQTAKIVQ
ncbi:MAG TPA: peptidylprolyl isomerase [Bryobacteraceae bacterium]|nr:peptidylprolyl isomerase [Bryobacteraceae bacterium]